MGGNCSKFGSNLDAIVHSLGQSWVVFGLDLVGLYVFRWLVVAIFFGVILVVTEEWLSFGGWCCVGTAE